MYTLACCAVGQLMASLMWFWPHLALAPFISQGTTGLSAAFLAPPVFSVALSWDLVSVALSVDLSHINGSFQWLGLAVHYLSHMPLYLEAFRLILDIWGLGLHFGILLGLF